MIIDFFFLIGAPWPPIQKKKKKKELFFLFYVRLLVWPKSPV